MVTIRESIIVGWRGWGSCSEGTERVEETACYSDFFRIKFCFFFFFFWITSFRNWWFSWSIEFSAVFIVRLSNELCSRSRGKQLDPSSRTDFLTTVMSNEWMFVWREEKAVVIRLTKTSVTLLTIPPLSSPSCCFFGLLPNQRRQKPDLLQPRLKWKETAEALAGFLSSASFPQSVFFFFFFFYPSFTLSREERWHHMYV